MYLLSRWSPSINAIECCFFYSVIKLDFAWIWNLNLDTVTSVEVSASFLAIIFRSYIAFPKEKWQELITVFHILRSFHTAPLWTQHFHVFKATYSSTLHLSKFYEVSRFYSLTKLWFRTTVYAFYNIIMVNKFGF